MSTEIVSSLKELLRKFSPPLHISKESEAGLELVTGKSVTLFGKEYPTLFFASVQPMKNHTGFYFFPIYTHPEAFSDLDPELRKMLKGKSCFHVKKLDDTLLQQLEALLQKGLEHYQQLGWA